MRHDPLRGGNERRVGEESQPMPQQFDIGRGEMHSGHLDSSATDG